MPTLEKEQAVQRLVETMGDAKSIFLTDFTGLSVEQLSQLRREFRKADVEYIVVKNTLAKISAQKVGYDDIVPYFQGPVGLAISKKDPVAPVRVIFDFKKKGDKPNIKGAYIEGQLFDQASAEKMKDIPSREVLLTQIASGFAAPISGLVGGLQGIITGLLYTLKAIQDKKE